MWKQELMQDWTRYTPPTTGCTVWWYFQSMGITSPVDISSLKKHLFYKAKSVQNKFEVLKFVLIIFFEQRERWRAFIQRLLRPMIYLYLAHQKKTKSVLVSPAESTQQDALPILTPYGITGLILGRIMKIKLIPSWVFIKGKYQERTYGS